MNVYFVRHGESTTNVDAIVTGQTLDPDLTERGREQAEAAAGWLRYHDIHIHHIISSPAKRARQTANIIATHINYPPGNIALWQDLQERDFGTFEGGPDQAYFDTPEAIAVSEHGTESIPAFYGRAQSVLNKLRHNYSTGNVLLVSHNGVGKMLSVAFEGRASDAYDRAQKLPNGEIIQLASESS
jgi:broad specificity phosphatase PhoE